MCLDFYDSWLKTKTCAKAEIKQKCKSLNEWKKCHPQADIKSLCHLWSTTAITYLLFKIPAMRWAEVFPLAQPFVVNCKRIQSFCAVKGPTESVEVLIPCWSEQLMRLVDFLTGMRKSFFSILWHHSWFMPQLTKFYACSVRNPSQIRHQVKSNLLFYRAC